MKSKTSQLASVLIASLAIHGASGCKKSSSDSAGETASETSAPLGGGRSDTLSTEIGNALAIEVLIAPTSAKWDHIAVLDDQTLVLAGRAGSKALAIKTTNSGKSWSGLSQPASDWSAWGFGVGGSAVLLSGKTKKGSVRGTNATIEELSVFFAQSDGKTLKGPISMPKAKPLLVDRFTKPAVVSRTTASVLLKQPKQQLMTTGSPSSLSKSLPGSGWIAAPYGMPPQLINVAGGQLKVRPWPQAGGLPETPMSVPNFRAGAATTNTLATTPPCSQGALTFQAVQDASRRPFAVGISAQRLLAVRLPARKGKVFGCGPGGVVVDTFDAKTNKLSLIQCPVKGSCATPKNWPFDLWTEKHDREIWAVTTTQGVVAVMEATAGNRWGLYLGYSLDGGKTFELAREIGTGNSPDRLRMGALVALGKRVLLFFTADTPDPSNSQRSWYVMASEDAGSTWAAP